MKTQVLLLFALVAVASAIDMRFGLDKPKKLKKAPAPTGEGGAPQQGGPQQGGPQQGGPPTPQGGPPTPQGGAGQGVGARTPDQMKNSPGNAECYSQGGVCMAEGSCQPPKTSTPMLCKDEVPSVKCCLANAPSGSSPAAPPPPPQQRGPPLIGAGTPTPSGPPTGGPQVPGWVKALINCPTCSSMISPIIDGMISSGQLTKENIQNPPKILTDQLQTIPGGGMVTPMLTNILMQFFDQIKLQGVCTAVLQCPPDPNRVAPTTPPPPADGGSQGVTPNNANAGSSGAAPNNAQGSSPAPTPTGEGAPKPTGEGHHHKNKKGHGK